MNINFLSKISPETAQSFPFGHAIIKNCLSKELCNTLIDEYPALEEIDPRSTENSFRFLYNTHEVQKDERISESWKEVLNYLSSPESFHLITKLFEEQLIKKYPKIFKNPDKIKQLRIGIRGIDSYLTKDVLLDAQIRGNTGDSGISHVQNAHIDSDYKIYSGLLYLRPDNDDTQGGDLEVRELVPSILYNLSDKQKATNFYRNGPYIDPKLTKIYARVPYEKNTLFLFMNSLESIHSVSERAPTKHTRQFIGFTAEMRKPLFMSQPTLSNKLNLIKKDIAFYLSLAKFKIRQKLSKMAWLKSVYRKMNHSFNR